MLSKNTFSFSKIEREKLVTKHMFLFSINKSRKQKKKKTKKIEMINKKLKT